MRDPNWWTEGQSSAWDRVKEAMRRDWDQTKADLSGKAKGHDLHQGVSDTVKQAAGTEVIPPSGVPNDDSSFSDFEPAYRYGAGAANRLAEDREWNELLEVKLSQEWTGLDPLQPWVDSKDYVRRGWEASKNETHGKSGKIGWAILWLLGIPLPVLLVLYLIRGH